MRVRSDILKEYQNNYTDCMDYQKVDKIVFTIQTQRLILEVLLDIREKMK